MSLIVGFASSIAAICAGSYLTCKEGTSVPSFLEGTAAYVGYVLYRFVDRPYVAGHWACHTSSFATFAIPLLLNYGVGAIFDGLKIIHSTTLRWALWEEHTLRYNSNPRLLTYAARHPPNSWYANTLSAAALVFAYGSLSLVTTNIRVLGYSGDIVIVDGAPEPDILDDPYLGSSSGIDFCGQAMIVLGICLSVQTFLAASCLLYRRGIVKTWSQNALTTARWCASHPAPDVGEIQAEERSASEESLSSSRRSCNLAGAKKRHNTASSYFSTLLHGKEQPGRSDTTLSSAPSTILVRPRFRQASARASVLAIRYILYVLWFTFLVAVVCTLAVIGIALQNGSTKQDYVQDFLGSNNNSMVSAYWERFGQAWFRYASNRRHQSSGFLGVTIQSLFQSVLTLPLHCTELLTNTLRDERAWRRAYSSKGARTNTNWFTDMLTDWPTIALFLFKGLAQWIFSCAITVNFVVVIDVIPMLTLVGLLFLLALSAELLARYQPKGPQPAAYGDLRLLMELMDEKHHDVIYWGDKGDLDGARITGTAGTPLAAVRRSQMYFGRSG